MYECAFASALVKTVNIVNQGTRWQIMGDSCGPDVLLHRIILCVYCDEEHPGAQVSLQTAITHKKKVGRLSHPYLPTKYLLSSRQAMQPSSS